MDTVIDQQLAVWVPDACRDVVNQRYVCALRGKYVVLNRTVGPH